MELPSAHIFGDFFDILDLIGVGKGDSGNTGKIDQSQIRTTGGVHSHGDWIIDDTLVLTSDLVSQSDNLFSDLVKVVVLLLSFSREFGIGFKLFITV